MSVKATEHLIFLFFFFSPLVFTFLLHFSCISSSPFFFFFSFTFLPLSPFSVLYHHILPIASTLLSESFSPQIGKEHMFSQKVLKTAQRHPASSKAKALRCQYSARIGKLLTAIQILCPQRPAVISVSVPLVETNQGTTSDLIRFLLGFINHRNFQRCNCRIKYHFLQDSLSLTLPGVTGGFQQKIFLYCKWIYIHYIAFNILLTSSSTLLF